MRHNITCAICGNLFNSSRNNAKYCCAECKIEGQKRTREDWKKLNPDYDKNRMKECRARGKANK